MYNSCTLCPRHCDVNRHSGQTGFCGMPASIQVARASLHMWEEPCISGTNGSGTVFFTGCNLKCVFCQNHTIAIGKKGREVSISQLADLFLMLQDKGAHNINLVTPSHYVPGIAEALRLAKKQGLCVPIVYNTSGYDSVSTLSLLDGLVDVYLPDFKYVSQEVSKRYSRAADYFKVAKVSLAEMFRQVGTPVFDGDMLVKGIVVRHLLLPGCTEDSKAVIRYLYRTYGDRIFISIMNQYTPLPHVASYPEINRKVTQAEYDEVVDYAIELGIENGFIQEGDTAEESFIPEFDFTGLL
ncbi:MAG: radical SAM protein [Lachnospiraceae bacterium]|nr:radical SAM protein [Lachnospiraceae bacterium]